MLIRPLTILDLPAVVVIEQAVQVSPWTYVMFEESLFHRDFGWSLMEEDRVCGYILVKPSSRHCERQRSNPAPTLDCFADARNDGSRGINQEADILTLAVAKNQQRKGYGRALIAFVLTQFDCVYLEVRISNQVAIKHYEKMGFEIVGKRPKYCQGEDAFVMKFG